MRRQRPTDGSKGSELCAEVRKAWRTGRGEEGAGQLGGKARGRHSEGRGEHVWGRRGATDRVTLLLGAGGGHALPPVPLPAIGQSGEPWESAGSGTS